MTPEDSGQIPAPEVADQSASHDDDTARRVSISERINLLIGIAGIVISLSMGGANWGGRRTIAIAAAVLLIALIFRMQSWLERNLKGVVPAVAIVIVALIPFLFVQESRVESAGANPQPTSNTPAAAPDQWTVWEQAVREGVKKCDATDYLCLANAISTPKYPKSNSKHLVDELNADIRAGSFLVNLDDKVFNMLDRCIGVKQNFIGDGLSLSDKAKYWERRVPEFLVANYSIETPTLWTGN